MAAREKVAVKNDTKGGLLRASITSFPILFLQSRLLLCYFFFCTPFTNSFFHPIFSHTPCPAPCVSSSSAPWWPHSSHSPRPVSPRLAVSP